jgi:hypothetical protein
VSRAGTTGLSYACQGRNGQKFLGRAGRGPENSNTSQILTNRIHDSTPGLSTPVEARERISSIQRILIYSSLSGVVTPWASGRKIKWRSSMKPFSFLKIPALLVGFGALLLFAPTCKAQSEVSPDHFDGTDPWEIAARKPVAPRSKPASGSYQAQNMKTSSSASLQLAAVRDLSNSTHHKAVAIQDKRKMAVRKSDKK